MKKFFAVVLTLTMFCTQIALAADLPDLTTYTDAELAELSDALDAEMAKRGSNASNSGEVAVSETLQQGSRGDAVKKLQLRLIELNYLSGTADGVFGGMTKSAVERFQKAASLQVTGVADAKTQQALYADDAPATVEYLKLDFKAISRDPDNYKGKNYSFSGKVLQVLEEASDNLTFVAMRIATKGNYDDVVYVTYIRENGESRILEDDKVTVYGTCMGLYTYETVIGGTVTLPEFMATTVTVN